MVRANTFRPSLRRQGRRRPCGFPQLEFSERLKLDDCAGCRDDEAWGMKKAPQTFCDSGLFESGIGQVVIVRYKGGGRVEMGVFLVDVFCLGVKNAFYTQCEEAEFDEFLEKLYSGRPVDEHSAAWGRKLVEGAMEYARRLGFAPHRHYKQAARVMGGINAKDCKETFVFGQNGMPMFIGGPNDNQARCALIISILRKKCGEGGFHFLIPASDADRLGLNEDWAD